MNYITQRFLNKLHPAGMQWEQMIRFFPNVNMCHNVRQKTVIDYFNGAKKKTHQGMLLIEILCGNVFSLMISAHDSKLLHNWLMQHVNVTNWCRLKFRWILHKNWSFAQQEPITQTCWVRQCCIVFFQDVSCICFFYIVHFPSCKKWFSHSNSSLLQCSL